MYSLTDFKNQFPGVVPVNAQVFGTSLIVAPHPDDETLGCGGTAALLLEMGFSVHFLFISDGTRSHPDSKKFPAEKLRALREAEARSAVDALGGKSDCIDFLALPDRQVPSQGNPYFEAAVRVATKRILHSRAESVFVPWENDPHPDHQATYQIIYAAVTRMQLQPRIIQYPVWLWELRDQADINKIRQMRLYSVDIGQTINKKIKAIDAHQSQITDLIDDDPNGFRLSEEMIAHFHATTELFFESNQPQSITMDNDKKTLDASYFNDLYSQNPDPWNFEQSEYEHTKYARTLGMISEMRFQNAFEIGCSNGKLSESLAVQCKRLLAVDSSSIAVANATRRLSGFENVRVEEMEIPRQFPDDTFDLILLSEVGYFFTENDLRAVCEKIISVLEPNGHILLVHWTGRVDEFPLSGDRVHQLFSEYSGDDELSPLIHLKNVTDAQYRMDLFIKRE